MSKVLVEFINTCPTCDGYSSFLNELQKQYNDQIEVKLYYAGKDFDYLEKYGMVDRGTLIINGKDNYDDVSKNSINTETKTAVDEQNA